MTVSVSRTIVLPTTRPLLTIFDGVFPPARPSDNLDYSADATAPLGEVADTLSLLTLTITPSGTGEMQCLAVVAAGSVITAQLAGGVAQRQYTIKVVGTGLSGRVWEWLFQLVVDEAGSVAPGPPPSTGPGAPVTWSSGVTPYIFPPQLVGPPATGLVLTSPPLLIAAQTNVIVSAPPGTSAILPTGVVGTIFVQNNDPADPASIYPPVGAQFQYGGTTLAVNDPFLIAANGGNVAFVTNSANTLWVVR